MPSKLMSHIKENIASCYHVYENVCVCIYFFFPPLFLPFLLSFLLVGGASLGGFLSKVLFDCCTASFSGAAAADALLLKDIPNEDDDIPEEDEEEEEAFTLLSRLDFDSRYSEKGPSKNSTEDLPFPKSSKAKVLVQTRSKNHRS
jgi:hypothetical protein